MSGSPLRHPDNSLRLDVLHRLDDMTCQFISRRMVPRKEAAFVLNFSAPVASAEPDFLRRIPLSDIERAHAPVAQSALVQRIMRPPFPEGFQ